MIVIEISIFSIGGQIPILNIPEIVDLLILYLMIAFQCDNINTNNRIFLL